MLNELKKLTKRSFKKNKKIIIISFLLLVTLTVFIHKLPYTLFKPLYNRLVNISLIIGIVLNFYYKNVVLASILVLALIIINYYGSNKYYVQSYNNNHIDNYRVQDNSIFSKIKLMLNNPEHFTEEGGNLNIPMMNDNKDEKKNGAEIAKEALDLIDNLVKEGQLQSLGDTAEHFDNVTTTQMGNLAYMTYPASDGTPVSTKVKNLIKNADKKLAEYKMAQNKLLAAEKTEMASIVTTTNPKLKALAKANVQAVSQATAKSTAKAAEYLKDIIEHQTNPTNPNNRSIAVDEDTDEDTDEDAAERAEMAAEMAEERAEEERDAIFEEREMAEERAEMAAERAEEERDAREMEEEEEGEGAPNISRETFRNRVEHLERRGLSTSAALAKMTTSPALIKMTTSPALIKMTTSPALIKMTTSARIRQKAPAQVGRSFKVQEAERFTNMTTSPVITSMTTSAQKIQKKPPQGGRAFKVMNTDRKENYTNFMSYELFSAQDNNIPQTTNIDNNVSPVLGTNEYCTQGNTLQSGVPVGFDFKCQMNCSNV
jgi:hypothetical protein